MNLEFDVEKLLLAHKSVRAELLAERAAGGYWSGDLGSSPVATAAAVSALVVSHRRDSDDVLRETDADDHVIAQLVQGDLCELLVESLHWLAKRQNDDGGWSDCDGADSNVAATMLVQAAFRLTGIPAKYADLMMQADDFVAAQDGIAGLRRAVGGDKTYLAPILANCALADMLPWRQVPTLPFEWLSLPGPWQRELYAPAAGHLGPIVLAVGLAKFYNDPPHNPVTRIARQSLRKRSLARLAHVQGADDSFLASPLVTAFVVMSLASVGLQEHPIVTRGIEFLLSSVRADSSWAVCTPTSTVNTALALGSLSAGQPRSLPHDLHARQQAGAIAHWEETATPRDTIDDIPRARSHVDAGHELHLTPPEEVELDRRTLEWLLNTQHVFASPLTESPAGGWGAGDAPGAEPNTIATGAALVALRQFYDSDPETNRRIEQSAIAGVAWLVRRQNENGGWSTFGCESETAVDPTVHAMRALAAWQKTVQGAKCGAAIARAMSFLESAQREDGGFVPVWFGNSHQRENENPVIGTSLVLTACAELRQLNSAMAQRAASWLAGAQHSSGGWGPPRVPVDYSEAEREGGVRSWRENDILAKFCSVEETAAAVSALLPLAATNATYERNVSRGLAWLADSVEHDGHRRPAIIGFYFWRIWYYERLYPLALAAGALAQAVGALAPAATAETSLNGR